MKTNHPFAHCWKNSWVCRCVFLLQTASIICWDEEAFPIHSAEGTVQHFSTNWPDECFLGKLTPFLLSLHLNPSGDARWLTREWLRQLSNTIYLFVYLCSPSSVLLSCSFWHFEPVKSMHLPGTSCISTALLYALPRLCSLACLSWTWSIAKLRLFCCNAMVNVPQPKGSLLRLTVHKCRASLFFFHFQI